MRLETYRTPIWYVQWWSTPPRDHNSVRTHQRVRSTGTATGSSSRRLSETKCRRRYVDIVRQSAIDVRDGSCEGGRRSRTEDTEPDTQWLIAVSSDLDLLPQNPANQRPASNEAQDDIYMAFPVPQDTHLCPASDVQEHLQVVPATPIIIPCFVIPHHASQRYQQNSSQQASTRSTSTNLSIRLCHHGRSHPTHSHPRSRSRRSRPSSHPKPALHPLHDLRT